jgi:predicted TIM-barrel fold metal-dependent hydrolase
LPYLAGRVDVLTTNNPALREFIPNGLAAELGKLYFDCALSTSATTLEALTRVATVDHVLFGSDYPFGPQAQMRKGVLGVQQSAWSEADKTKVAHGNALRLFPRLAGIVHSTH